MEISKIHIIPVDDIEEHEQAVNCHCHPEIRKENENNWLVIHNAFDGREWDEMLLSNNSTN